MADTELNEGERMWYLGNLEAAIWHFQQALQYRQSDAKVLAWLNAAQQRVEAEANERKRREQEEANQRRAENVIAILVRGPNAFDAQANAMDRILSSGIGDVALLPFLPPSAAQVKPVSDGGLPFISPNIVTLPNAKVFYPALLRPLPPHSIPVQVLAKREPDIKELDQKIRQAQEALRRLIRSNQQNEEARKEWTAESLEATYDARWLALNLWVDLLDAHVDHMTGSNKEERQEVLNRLLNRGEETSKGKSLHNLYGMLLNEKSTLDRLHDEARLAHKESDLAKRIDEIDKDKSSEFTLQDFHDAVTQFKKIEDLEGPWNDLLDASYTLYRQASSLERMLEVEGNQVKSLDAATKLQKYIEGLVKQRQVAKSHASSRGAAKAAEPSQ